MEERLFNAIEIEINHGCNMSCSYCPNSKFNRIETGEMDPELYSKIISQLVDLSYEGRISYHFYNEPLLCSKLIEFVSIARKALPSTSIELYSNGTYISPVKFQELIHAGVSKFIITKQEKVSTSQFEETFAILSNEDKEKVIFRSYEEMTFFNRGGVLPGLGEARDMNLQPCYIPSEIMTVTVKGNVVPCFEDFFQRHQMGNVNDMHLGEIWNQNKYSQLRKKLRQGLRHQFDICKDCNRHEVVFT